MCVRSSEPRRRNLLHFFGKRVFIAGLGDSGVLTAIKLARHADVVGISAKPALVSGPELGSRLSGPAPSCAGAHRYRKDHRTHGDDRSLRSDIPAHVAQASGA